MSCRTLIGAAPVIWPGSSPSEFFSSKKHGVVASHFVPRRCQGSRCRSCSSTLGMNNPSAEGPPVKEADKAQPLSAAVSRPTLLEGVTTHTTWTEEELFRAYNREELEYRMSDEEWDCIVEEVPLEQRDEAREDVRRMKERQNKADEELRLKCKRVAEQLRRMHEPSDPA